MYGINKVILIGHLGGEPEKMVYDKARKVSFSLAVNERGINKDGTVTEHTEWVSIVCWNELADLAERLLTKGTLVYVEGKLRTRAWNNKEGENRKATAVNMERFVILSSGERNKNRSCGEETNPAASDILEEIIQNEDDAHKLRDLPF